MYLRQSYTQKPFRFRFAAEKNSILFIIVYMDLYLYYICLYYFIIFGDF